MWWPGVAFVLAVVLPDAVLPIIVAGLTLAAIGGLVSAAHHHVKRAPAPAPAEVEVDDSDFPTVELPKIAA